MKRRKNSKDPIAKFIYLAAALATMLAAASVAFIRQ